MSELKKKIRTIVDFVENAFICILTFLTTLIINFPKYSIDQLLTSEIQAIFGIIVMPATFMLLVGNFILNPILVQIAKYYNQKKYNEIQKLLFKIFGIMLLIGVFAIIGCYLLGIPLLNFIYNLDLEKYKVSLLIIIIGSIIYAMTATISSILVAMRKIKSQVVGNLIVVLFAFLICDKLVFNYNIFGGALAYTILILIRFLIYFIMFEVFIHKNGDYK